MPRKATPTVVRAAYAFTKADNTFVFDHSRKFMRSRPSARAMRLPAYKKIVKVCGVGRVRSRELSFQNHAPVKVRVYCAFADQRQAAKAATKLRKIPRVAVLVGERTRKVKGKRLRW